MGLRMSVTENGVDCLGLKDMVRPPGALQFGPVRSGCLLGVEQVWFCVSSRLSPTVALGTGGAHPGGATGRRGAERRGVTEQRFG